MVTDDKQVQNHLEFENFDLVRLYEANILSVGKQVLNKSSVRRVPHRRSWYI